MSKIYDCVTFFQENLLMKLRFSILKDFVDKFIVCESIYDHRGKFKDLNFFKDNFPEVKDKIEHIIIKKNFQKTILPGRINLIKESLYLKG